MKRLFAFLLCGALVCMTLMLAGCGCVGCGMADTNDPAGNAGMSGGSANDPMTGSTNNSTDIAPGVTTGTGIAGNVAGDVRNGVDNFMDDAEALLDGNTNGNTIDGTLDGADTYGATDDTNLDDMKDGKSARNGSNGVK